MITHIVVNRNHQIASGKTRKLLNKHGSIFELLKYGYEHSGQRQEEILIKSITTGWSGWLSVSEITYEEYNGPLNRESFSSNL